MILDALTPFVTVALAELGDKSQVSVLLLSTRTKKHFRLLAGVMSGFLLVDGVAILGGAWMISVVPQIYLRYGAALLFLLLGIAAFLKKKEDQTEKLNVKNPFLAGFGIIALTEWGDKTQIASAVFTLRYDAILVFVSVMLALALLSVSAVYLGKYLLKKVDIHVTTRIAGAIFIVLAVVTLAGS